MKRAADVPPPMAALPAPVWGIPPLRCLSNMADQDRPQDSSETPDWDGLARMLAGEVPASEQDLLRDALEANAARALLVHALDAALRSSDPAPPTADEVEAALLRVKARRGDERVATVPRRVVSLDAYRTRWRVAGLRAAAAVLVVAGAGLIWRAASPGSAPASLGGPSRFATTVGVLDSLQLPDGSRVLLGPGSELVLGQGFGSAAREMTLKGEARFDVVHDESRPFVVRTTAATFRDVGTVFSVHGDDAGGASIAVTEGAVSAQRAGGAASVTLRAGDRATVGPEGSLKVERAAVTSDDLAWTKGQLVFRDAPMPQVRADLRRWYGLELQIDSALSSKRLTATFDRGSGGDVVGIIAATLGGVVQQEGGTLRIVSAGAAHR